MKKCGLNSIKKEFMDIHGAIQDLSDDMVLNHADPAVSSHFARLHQIISQEIDDRDADELLNDREFQPVINRIAHLKRTDGLRMEIERAKAIISAPDPWSLIRSFKFYPNYLKLAQMEYRGADLKPGDRVVFLGCGPLPLSLICLCTQHGIKGIGIELVPEYAKLSQKIIEALELTDHVQILQGNHFSLPLEESCNLVMVGSDAIPKDEIFAHLAKTLPKGAKLSYRIYEKGLRRLMEDHPITNLPDSLKEYTRTDPKPPVNNTSVFIEKTAS
ncbi:MAG: methyltransferase [Desulfobacteraceae bacterium]|nr:methyltransferase [Desulfobacteraceae bacterium]